MKSPAAIITGSDPVVGDVGEAVGVMTGVRVCVAVCPAVGMEVVVDVGVDMFVGVTVDVDPLVVMTNWGEKPAVPSLDE